MSKEDIFFIGIDDSNRANFRSYKKNDLHHYNFYYVENVSFDEFAGEETVLKQVSEKDILFKGYSFNSDPVGSEANCRIIRRGDVKLVHYVGIDSFDRPTFKSIEFKDEFYYHDLHSSIDENTSEDEILAYIDEKDLLYKGSQFESEPMGTPANCRILLSEEFE